MSGNTFDGSDSHEADLAPSWRNGAPSRGMLKSEVKGFANTNDRSRAVSASSSGDPLSSRTNATPGNVVDQLDNDKGNRPRPSTKYTKPRDGGVAGCRPQQEPVLSPLQGAGGCTNETVLSPLQGAGGCTDETEKVTNWGSSLRAAENDVEPFARLCLREKCIRTKEKTKVDLIVDQVVFGVKNCCTGGCSARKGACNQKCKKTFIYEATIEVTPKSWPVGSYLRFALQPENRPLVFTVQKITNWTIQSPFACLSKASVMFQCGKAISRTVPSFEWRPARTDPASHSVSWTFVVNTHSDGKRLKFKQRIWGGKPVLAISPDHIQFENNAETFKAEASWELPPNAELEPQRLEWEVNVTLRTAVLRNRRWFSSVIDAPHPLSLPMIPMS